MSFEEEFDDTKQPTEEVDNAEGKTGLSIDNIPDDIKSQIAEEVRKNTIEEVAKSLGWKDEQSFEGNKKNFTPADEYVRNTPKIEQKLRKTIDKQGKKIDHVVEGMKNLTSHTRKVINAEREKNKAELQAARRETIKDGDVDATEAIDVKIDEIKREEILEESQSDSVVADQEAFDDFMERNPWYNTDPDLTNIAHSIAKASEGLSYEETLAKVEKDLKPLIDRKAKEEEEKEVTLDPSPGRNKEPDDVESGSSRVGGKRYTTKDLTPFQLEVAKTFVSDSDMTMDQYIAELVAIGEVK